MTTLSRAQINKAINDRIIEEFPDIEIQSIDVEEGFKRPSFFVSIETRSTEAFISNRHREMTCRIVYFPTDRHVFKDEAYDVMDRLENLFGLNFVAGDRVITINSAEADIIDKVVHYDFEFNFYEDIQQEEVGEEMQELIVNGG